MVARSLIPVALVVLVAGCSDVSHLGAAAFDKRRSMNDIQARATMAALCDISVGAYFRELSDAERRYTALVCGGIQEEPLPAASSFTPPEAAVEETVPQSESRPADDDVSILPQQQNWHGAACCMQRI